MKRMVLKGYHSGDELCIGCLICGAEIPWHNCDSPIQVCQECKEAVADMKKMINERNVIVDD